MILQFKIPCVSISLSCVSVCETKCLKLVCQPLCIFVAAGYLIDWFICFLCAFVSAPFCSVLFYSFPCPLLWLHGWWSTYNHMVGSWFVLVNIFFYTLWSSRSMREFKEKISTFYTYWLNSIWHLEAINCYLQQVQFLLSRSNKGYNCFE